DLHTKSNTSFAAVPLDDTPRRAQVGALHSQPIPILGTRGSPKLSGPWRGIIAFSDGHVDAKSDAFFTSAPPAVDHLFRNNTFTLPTTDPRRNSDAFLVLQRGAAAPGTPITETSSEVTWDERAGKPP
ncbi:MAG: hypothetical protein JNK53_01275, partial [Phycisphaerae bacterium]|nr:hypothetical protein [Phycisphaerae bacterium]